MSPDLTRSHAWFRHLQMGGRLPPALILVVLFVFCAGIYLAGGFSRFDAAVTTSRFEWSARPASDKVAIVTVRGDQFRSALARLESEGARVVGLVSNDGATIHEPGSAPRTASAELLVENLAVRRYVAKTDDGIPTVAFAMAQHPVAVAGFQIDYGIASQTIPRFAADDLLAGRFAPDSFKGKLVLVGSHRSMLVPTGLARDAHLDELTVHALALESIVQQRMLASSFTPLISLLFAALILVVLRQIAMRAGGPVSTLATLVLAGTSYVVSVLIQVNAATILDIMPTLVVLAGGLAQALYAKVDEAGGLKQFAQAARARRSERFMSRVVDKNADAIITIGSAGAVVSVNESAVLMFGWASSEASGRAISELILHSEDAARSGAEHPTKNATQPIEAVGLRRTGEMFSIELSVSEVDDGGSRLRTLVIRDITQRKLKERQLEHRALHDVLTGLPNRDLLKQQLDRTLVECETSGQPAALLLLDLDGFKAINDTLGHKIGDSMLIHVAQRLQLPLRDGDLLARLGGDEFAIILPNTNEKSAVRMARRVEEAVRAPFRLDELTLQVSSSIGVALYPSHGESADQILHHSDVAMYVAKRRECGISVYDPEDDFNNVRRLTLRGDLKRAIDENKLEVHFQPKVSIRTGEIVGAEALVRWFHEDHGMLPPSEFITLAEQGGLITPLTFAVLEKILSQQVVWQEQGIELPVSINVSARSLQEESLPSAIAQAMRRHGIDPVYLTLEITESVLMTNPDRAMPILTELSELGFRISIDDYGTGYSSLSYLKQLPACELKIDRSFVMELPKDEEVAVIVRSTIDMAHSLGLSVVAEGIERQEAWETLQNFGCDVGQGYFFGRPVPADKLTDLLLTTTAFSTPGIFEPVKG